MGKTIRTLGFVVGALCFGGGIAAGVLTGETWIAGVGAGVGVLLGGGIAWIGQRKIDSAEALTVTNLYEYDITDHLAVNACSINNQLTNDKCLGAGICVKF